MFYRFGLGKHLLVVQGEGSSVVVDRLKALKQRRIELAIHQGQLKLLGLLPIDWNSSCWIGLDGPITKSRDIDLQPTIVPFKGIFRSVIDRVRRECRISRSGDSDVVVDESLDELECPEMGFGGQRERPHNV